MDGAQANYRYFGYIQMDVKVSRRINWVEGFP